MLSELTELLTNLIGLNYISYQSNSGAMGEYSGLLSIKQYHNNNPKKYFNANVEGTLKVLEAAKENRVKKFKSFIDHILLLFPFEKKYYDEENIKSTFIFSI